MIFTVKQSLGGSSLLRLSYRILNAFEQILERIWFLDEMVAPLFYYLPLRPLVQVAAHKHHFKIFMAVCKDLRELYSTAVRQNDIALSNCFRASSLFRASNTV